MIKFVLLSAFCFSYLGVGSMRSNADPTRIPRTVSIGYHISMRATEVTVEEWMDFIVSNNFDTTLFPDAKGMPNFAYRLVFEDLKSRGRFKYVTVSKSLQVSIVNRVLWDSVNHMNEVYPANTPVVGISFEQARLFCKWKEGQINAVAKSGRLLTVGLPSIGQYDELIENIDSAKKSVKKSCPVYGFNFNHEACERFLGTGGGNPGVTLVRVDAYWPSKLGLYNLQGNAAEMTSSEGIAMGGSYRHYAWQCAKGQRQMYKGSQDWLGFRFVVSEKKAD
jgi:formylglycine-generating enzyme required for sulfatase activity